MGGEVVYWIGLSKNCVNESIILPILWPMAMDQGWVPLGQAIRSLDPVALFHFAIVNLLPVDLFNYKTRKILQGVAFSVKMTSYWFFQQSMFNIWSMAIHLYVKCILCYSNILFIAFCTFDYIDHISCVSICSGFDWIGFPSDQALEIVYWFDVITHLTMSLLALGIPLERHWLFLLECSPSLVEFLN